MNVRGERILIFGDSLTHHGADAGPEIWDVNAGSSRSSSAPGDILASLLLEQGAAAVRTDARVGRSAANFYERENATSLIASDRTFHPTKVVVMLGTNDIGRDISKTTTAMAGIKSAYEGMGAEVWAVGPFTYNNDGMNQQAAGVAQLMHNVFGGRFIDGRPLSVQTGRAGDGVHFGQDSARQTALNIGNALMSTGGHGDLFGSILLGAGLALGALALFKIWNHEPQHRQLTDLFGLPRLAAPNPDKPSIDELARRARKAKEARERMVRDAFGQSPAVILTTKHGDEKLAIMSGEMQDTEHGKLRVTYFGTDGPIGHATRKSLKAIVEDVIDYFPTSVRPATEEEIMRWTSSDEFIEGAERVAATQRANRGLKGSKKSKRGKRTALGDPRDEAIAYAIKDSAARAPKFGTRKVFISDLLKQLRDDGRDDGMTPSEFKRELLRLNRAGLIELTRADLVAAMPEKKVAASETDANGATYHFLVV